MSEEVIAGSALAEPQTEARDVIATCRSAWGTAHASQTDGGEARAQAIEMRRLQEEEEEGPARPPDRGATRRGGSKDEEGEAEWKDDMLAPIRRLALLVL
jgi:hypothetical protein